MIVPSRIHRNLTARSTAIVAASESWAPDMHRFLRPLGFVDALAEARSPA